MAAIKNEIATLIIKLQDGTELYLGDVEIKSKISKSVQDNLKQIIKDKQRIIEPVYN